MDQSLWQTLGSFWSLTDITPVITDNVVTWETRLNMVDWVCSKTHFFWRPWGLKINLGWNLTFSEVEHSSPLVGSARNKRQHLTVPQTRKLIRWMLVYEWTGFLLFDLWDVVTEVLRSSKSTESPTHGAAGNCWRNHNSKPPKKGNRDVDQCHMWTTSPETQILLKASLSCTSLIDDNEAVIKMIIKGRNPTMRHVSRTHRGALDWSFQNNLDPKTRIKYVDTENPTRGHVDQR